MPHTDLGKTCCLPFVDETHHAHHIQRIDLPITTDIARCTAVTRATESQGTNQYATRIVGRQEGGTLAADAVTVSSRVAEQRIGREVVVLSFLAGQAANPISRGIPEHVQAGQRNGAALRAGDRVPILLRRNDRILDHEGGALVTEDRRTK